MGERFELDYDRLLYEVTSTYFEGQAEKNPQAQRGNSRDDRPDCQQVNIALVVSRCGMPLGYEIFAGHRKDATTLEEMVEHIEGLYGRANRIWVMDRGMAGEDNVKFLREGGRRGGFPSVPERPAAGQGAGHRRALREADRGRSSEIQASGQKKKPKPVTIATRVGRLLERNRRAAALFEVQVEADASGFARLRWSKREAWRQWARLSEDCYLLRSRVTDWSAEDLWRAYIPWTEAEAAFRIPKSDLTIRPLWHQTEDRVQAPILVCLLADLLR